MGYGIGFIPEAYLEWEPQFNKWLEQRLPVDIGVVEAPRSIGDNMIDMSINATHHHDIERPVDEHIRVCSGWCFPITIYICK